MMRAGYILTPGVLVKPGELEPYHVCAVVFAWRCGDDVQHRMCGLFDTPEQAITARQWFTMYGHPLPERDGVQ